MVQGITRCFDMVLGNTMDSHKTFMDHLTISPRLREVHSINDSDDIIAFVPVVSRAGTDIQAAMNKIPKDKPVVLVMLHHTFNPDAVVPNVRPYVDRKDVFVVDCLFHEDQGLLRCPHNDDAIRAVKNHLIREDHSEFQMRKKYYQILSLSPVKCLCNDDYWWTVTFAIGKTMLNLMLQ
ncbi:hypothetical protein QTP86_009842 [Hemibagrus guttatus]|nr:hypothetical protein QTP86_009842 [Hemibagrus guttatus]